MVQTTKVIHREGFNVKNQLSPEEIVLTDKWIMMRLESIAILAVKAQTETLRELYNTVELLEGDLTSLRLIMQSNDKLSDMLDKELL
jgi:hypothetical protein